MDKKVVEDKVNQLLAESRSLYASDPLQQRRIELILGHFLENVKSFPSNSTEGYLASLKQVDAQYIHATQAVKPKEETALDRRYQELLEQVRLLDTEAFQLKKGRVGLSIAGSLYCQGQQASRSRKGSY